MVELIVAMVILVTLCATAFFVFHGARSSASVKETTAAAGSYSGAIASFKLDHAGRVPTFGNATDWPVAADGPLMQTLGPNNKPNRYIRGGAPGAVTDRRVVISTGAPAVQPIEAKGWIQYVPAPDQRSFQLRTFTRDAANLPWAPGCAFSDGVAMPAAGASTAPAPCT